MRLLIISLLFISCGKIKIEPKPIKVDKIQVETNIPDKIEFGPNFESASQLCDTRYGANTPASDDCFDDYRNFYSPQIRFDFASISNFCDTRYTTIEDVAGCEKDLIDIISKSVGGLDEV